MAEQFLGQIEAFGFNFAPRGWLKCDGQLLSISQNSALFSLLGTTYGGDGRTTFGVPDLRGRASINAGRGPGLSDYRQGQKGGAESTNLTGANLPSHGHTARVAAEPEDSSKPEGNSLAAAEIYRDQNPDTDLRAGTIGTTGGGQPISNIQPFVVLNWCIAQEGVYPSRS